MEQNTYKIIIRGQLSDELDRQDVISKLAALFKVSEDRAEKILSRPETVIKENLDETTARKYQLAISNTGAHSEIINTAEEELELPVIDETVKPVNEQNLARDQDSVHQDPVLGMPKRDMSKHQETQQKLELMDNYTEKHHCPECGAIKESEQAICSHCGAEPAAKKFKLSRILNLLLKTSLVLIVLAVLAYAAMPFYQDFAKRFRIKQGLSLAVDTRDTITAFILETGFWPNQNLDADLPKNISNDIVESIVLTGNGAFTVTLKPELFETDEPQTLIFKPKSLRGNITWNCMGGTLSKIYRSEECMPRQ